jgi:hypothetical protein
MVRDLVEEAAEAVAWCWVRGAWWFTFGTSKSDW